MNQHLVRKKSFSFNSISDLFIDTDQQQTDLARYSTVVVNLLDFVDYCNDIIDIHPSTTPQYKCAVKVS